MRALPLRVVVVLAFALTGCSGSSGSSVDAAPSGSASGTEPGRDVLAGTWSGTWTSETTVSGSFVATFARAGDAVTGEIRFTGSPCFAGGRYEGTVTGDEVTGALRAGDIRVDMRASVVGDMLNGSYVTVSGGACTGDQGTFFASR